MTQHDGDLRPPEADGRPVPHRALVTHEGDPRWIFTQRAAGRDHAGELRKCQRDAQVRAVLAKHIVPLVAVVERREAAIRELAEAIKAFPDKVRARIRAGVVAASEQREADLAKEVASRHYS